MNRVKIIVTSGLFCLLLFTAYRPSGNLEELSEKIISLLTGYMEETPEEKVFLHLDKDHYAAGEDIWFSVYLTAGSPDILSPLSKTVYVDMLDNNGTLIEQKTIRINEGHGYGDFKLPYFVSEGLYHIKAYSTWIRGFGEEQVFSRQIEIFEPLNMNFQPHVTFNFESGKEGEFKYVGKIKTVNKDLRALKDKKIQYQIISSQHLLGEGELKLDEEGAVDLEVFLEEADLQNPVFLKLIYEENEDFLITRMFKFPFPDSVIDLQFMPEGGEIIEGFANKIAFRAVYPDGSPAEVKGKLRGAEGFSEDFETNSNGLGHFTFTPQSADYRAFLMSQNEEQGLAFPKILSKGVNLTIDTGNAGLLNMLIQTKDYASLDANMEGLLVVHARGMIGHMQKLDMTAGVAGARVNTSLLAPGINQVTVFNGSGQALAERLVFVDFTDTPTIEILAETKDLQKKGKNVLKLKLDADQFEGGNYSVSITDASGPVTNGAANIVTYLKFSAELKGKVHDHDLYVDGKLDPAAIDLIMLTNGWRRFDWDKVFDKNYKNEAHIEQGINVMGTVSPKHKTRKGLEGGTLNFFSRGAEEDFIVADFTENGRFIIDGLDFTDTTTLVLNAKDKRQKDMLDITVDEPASKYLQWDNFEPLLHSQIIHPSFKEYLETADKLRQTNIAFSDPDMMDLDEFVVEHIRFPDEEDGITRIYGKGNKKLKVADIPGMESANTILEMLQGRMAGVKIRPDLINPKIWIRNGSQVLILLDNVPIDLQTLNTINPRDVDIIEAFTDGAYPMFGPAGAHGAIAIYTKQGGSSYSPAEGVLHAKYPGYSSAREFYVPKYDEEKSSKPDYRNTLYWNPLLSWNGNEAEIEFYNNDVSDKFKVVVQGMDKFGRLTYAEKIID